MIEVRVEGILLDNVNNSPVVLLREIDGDRVLPIFIGPLEASAIAYAIERDELTLAVTRRNREMDTLKDIGNMLSISTFDID